MRQYFVYILASAADTLYIGITNDLHRRVYEHQHKLVPGFTGKYNVTRLVYWEETPDAQVAIAREKQLKGWTRAKKRALIEEANPGWIDLSAGWFPATRHP
jgi:putative endonuclease